MSGLRPALQPWPLAMLTFCASLGPLPFGLVGFAMATAGRATVGWAAIGVLAAPALAMWACRWAPPRANGGVLAAVWALGAAAFFLSGAAIGLHLWLEVLRVSEYPFTPAWALAAFTLSAVAYTARTGIENLLRLAVPMAVIVLLTAATVFALAWGLGKSGRLIGGAAPLTATGALPAAWPLLVFAAHGSLLSPVFLPYTAQDRYRWPAVLAAACAGLLLALAYVLPIVVWDVGPALRTEFPLLHTITPVSTIFFPVHRLALLAFVPLELNLIAQIVTYVLAALELAGQSIFPLASAPALIGSCVVIGLFAVWPAPSFTVARLAALWSLGGLCLLAALPLAALLRSRAPVAQRT